MILTCPACDTKYVVKDGAIPAGGRNVRCAACKHSWHQDPEEGVETGLEAQEGAGEQSIAEAAMIEPRTGPEAEERAYQEAMIDDQSGPVADDLDVAAAPAETVGEYEPAAPPERDQWEDTGAVTGAEAAAALQPEPAAEWLGGSGEAQASEFEPFYEPEPVATSRRRMPWLVVVLLLVAALAAAGWFLAPEALRARLGLANPSGTPLQVMLINQDRQSLASGNELFAVSGRVINPSDETQTVPPLLAELLDETKQRVVYRWTIAPPAPTLAPGTSASFNSAEVDVPAGGKYVRVTLDGTDA